MNILTISSLTICIVFICFTIYELYRHRKEYKIIKKFSINNGEDEEYYLAIRRTSNKNEFTIQVNKETYEIYDLNDYIIIL